MKTTGLKFRISIAWRLVCQAVATLFRTEVEEAAAADQESVAESYVSRARSDVARARIAKIRAEYPNLDAEIRMWSTIDGRMTAAELFRAVAENAHRWASALEPAGRFTEVRKQLRAVDPTSALMLAQTIEDWLLSRLAARAEISTLEQQ